MFTKKFLMDNETEEEDFNESKMVESKKFTDKERISSSFNISSTENFNQKNSMTMLKIYKKL